MPVWGKYADMGRAVVNRGRIVGMVVRNIKCPLVRYILMNSFSISVTGSEEERREQENNS